jgi:hypothetical protein
MAEQQQWKGDDKLVVAPGVVTTTLDGWHYEHAPGETWPDEEEGAPLLLLIEPSHGREVLLMDENAAASKLQSVTRGQYARSAALNRQRPRDCLTSFSACAAACAPALALMPTQPLLPAAVGPVRRCGR